MITSFKHTLVYCFLLLGLLASAAGQVIENSKGIAEGDMLFFDSQLLPIEGKAWDDTEAYFDRLPARAKEKVRPPVWNLSKHTTGMLYRFSTTSKKLTVRWHLTSDKLDMHHMSSRGVSGIDVYGLDNKNRWRYIPSKFVTQVGQNEAKFYLGSNRYSEVLVYLPLFNGIKSMSIGITENSKLEVREQKRPLVVIYGTSITHGSAASRAGLSFPSIVGRRLDVEVINLGFSGNGKLGPEVAEFIAELEPDLFVIDPLRNNGPEDLRLKYEPFVRTILAKHPNVPMILADEAQFNAIGPIEDSVIVEGVQKKLHAEGYLNVSFLPNEGMLGSDSEGTVDGTHPNDLGMMRMADVFTPAIADALGLRAAK